MSMAVGNPNQWAVTVIGEVLFDVFPDGPRLGGAPFNVAWHLAGLATRPRFISRVGRDDLASIIIDAMTAHGMDTAGLQSDTACPTGRVNVTLDGKGGHRFEICPDQAYDHIDAPPTHSEADPDLIYYGTLALRGHDSRNTILNRVDACSGQRLLDVNLRDGCWNNTTLEGALKRATVVKLNDDELNVLAKPFNLDGDLATQATQLRRHFGLEAVCVTAAENGAHWFDSTQSCHVPAAPVEVVDTVGAGDGFAAVLAYGLMAGWPARQTLTRAAGFAAAICERRGACPDDPGFYRQLRDDWKIG